MKYKNVQYIQGGSISAEFNDESLSIPLDPANRHYAEIMRQVDAGELVIEPDPGPSEEQVSERARNQRDRLLKESDWTQIPDAPVDRTIWAEYRQALRDVPSQSGFPTDIEWPKKPEERT